MFSIIKTRKIWYVVSSTLVILSLLGFIVWGLRPGIDFTGGSLIELNFTADRPTNEQIVAVLEPLDLGNITVTALGETGSIIRLKDISEATHQEILKSLKEGLAEAGPQEQRFETIGPTLGNELRQKTFWAISLVILAIIAYIAWAFRKVSRPVASWKYGVVAAIALFHDVAITVGIFTVLGYFYGIEINTPFIAAILTIMGYSVNDTIVVFDRTRENLLHRAGESFADVVERSLQETISRSINTNCTALLALFSIFLLGGASLRDFIFTLIIGIIVGTYSSIFIASPYLVTLERLQHKKSKK